MGRSPLRALVWLFVVLALVVSACADSDSPLDPVTAVGLEPLDGFGSATLVVGGASEFPVMLAETSEQRSRGLMAVTDLGGWAGMAFVFDEPTETGFWMKDTLLPLTIFWVGAGGVIVSSADMEPCAPGTECINYAPGTPYLWALEIEAGTAEELGISPTTLLLLTSDVAGS